MFIDFAALRYSASIVAADFSVTGGTVATGVIQVRPFQNQSNNSTVTLTGTRDDNVSVWVKNTSTRLEPPVSDGLVLWMDADDYSTITESDGKVVEWRDKSGYNNHLTAVSGSEPVYVAKGHNGRSVLRFDSSRGKYLSFTSRISDIRTVFWVLKQDGASNNYGPFLLGDSSSYHFHRGSGGQI